MTESMASEPAGPTTRPQDDRVGTVRRLGNSWFMKLVEPASEPWHVVCSDGQQDVSGWQDDESMEDCPVVGYLPVVECVPSLLADPAQTTEQHAERLDRALWLWAEEKWRREQLLAQREQWWEHVGRERAQLESERDERQARIDEIADVLGRAPGDATSAEIVEIVRTAVAVKGRRRDEAMELRARIDAVTATCEAADVMVRMGMATSTLRWETAKAVLDDVRAALVGDQGKHLGENQAKSGGSEALTSGNSWANRDLDLSGAALRAVEEADDAAGDLP